MIELLAFISQVVGYVVQLYIYIIVASALLSLLMAFNVINPYNPFVRSLYQGLYAVTEPALRPIRRRMPDTGGIDFSPLVLIVLLIIFVWFVQGVLIPNLAKLFV